MKTVLQTLTHSEVEVSDRSIKLEDAYLFMLGLWKVLKGCVR